MPRNIHIRQVGLVGRRFDQFSDLRVNRRRSERLLCSYWRHQVVQSLQDRLCVTTSQFMNAQVRACRVDGVIGLVAEHQVDHVGQVVFAILLANGECGRCQGAVEDTNSVQTIEKLLKVQTETERYCLVV